jgi:membrane associated rhomboid family serine protease
VEQSEMGLYDRDYYREKSSNWLDPALRSPVCLGIIGLTLTIFLFQIASFGRDNLGKPRFGLIDQYGALEAGSVLNGEPWRLLTYAFLGPPGGYGGLALFFELALLWYFGGMLESDLGPKRFLGFFLIASMISGLAFNLANWAAAQPGFGRAVPIITGPGGALTAILVSLAVREPGRIISVFLLPLPIWFFLVLHVLQDSIGLFGRLNPPNIVGMHLAAGLMAFAYELFRAQQTVRKEPTRPRSAPAMESIPASEIAKVESKPVIAERVLDEHSEAKMDAILEKVNAVGFDQLTQSERDFLKEASQRIKERKTQSRG